MKSSKRIAIISILIALEIVLTVLSRAIPSVAGVSFGFLMLLPVLVSAATQDLLVTLVISFVMGLTSLATAPMTALAPIFLNPMVSIFPRLFIGPVSWAVFRYFNKLLHKTRLNDKLRFTVTSVTASAAGVLTNTGLVIAMIAAFYFNKEIANGTVVNAAFITTLIGINFVVELAVSIFIVPPLVFGLKKAMKQPLDFNGDFPRRKISVSNTMTRESAPTESCGDDSNAQSVNNDSKTDGAVTDDRE